jgi:hypothetical protein
LKSGKTTPDVHDSYAYVPPSSGNVGQLSTGTELTVVNVTPNDILKIREYPTDNSRVIDIIPPDAKGVVYLGEAQGEWIFVRYLDRARGWVDRRHVVPITSRGERL